MNYLQLVQRGKSEAEIAGPPPLSVVGLTANTLRLANAISNAWVQIQMLPFNWRWMRATALGDVSVAGGMAYSIDELLGVAAGTTRFAKWLPPSTHYRVRAYDPANVNGGEWPLCWEPYDLFQSRFLVGVHTAAAPQFWSVAPDNELLIGPTPDRTYRLRADYLKSPQILALDADTPECPSQYHMAPVWKALASRGLAGAEPETVARAMGEYSEIESALIRDQGERITILASPLS